jgi:predicted enzyme related to lactoylglutathione lyase
MMIIAFVSYPVSNLDRAVEFYQKVLGIEPLFHREDWAEFKLEGQRFALKKETIRQKREDTGATVYFMAKPMQKFIDRLEGFDTKILGSLETHSYGKLARFKDPEGNIFGLYEPPIISNL